MTLDLRKVPQSGDLSHCFFYWTLEIRMFRGYFWTAPYVSMGRPSSSQSMYVRPSGVTTLNCLYLTQFLTDFGQILDSKSYDQALQTL